MGNDVSTMDVLKNTPFAMFLSEDVVHDISLCFAPLKFKPGATIAFAKQEFLIVARGSADMSTIMPHAQKKVKVMELLCKKKVGDILTHCARGHTLLHRKSSATRRSSAAAGKNVAAMLDLVTVTADKAEGCVLLRLNRDKFVKVRSQHMMNRPISMAMSINKAQRTAEDDWHLVSTIADNQIVDYLAAVPFFSDVKSSRLSGLAGLCTFMIARKDDIVCRENDFGDKFYICVQGMLSVTVATHASHAQAVSNRSMSTLVAASSTRSLDAHRSSVDVSEVLIRRIADGSYFGEISLILNIRRSATVTAVDDSLLVYIDAGAFRNFLKVCPDVKGQLEIVVINRLLQLASKAPSAGFLAALSNDHQTRLAHAGTIVEVAKGCQVVAHGDDPVFYIVLNGKVEVEYALPSGSLYVAMGPGGYFGELSIILQTKSLVQVAARDDSVLLALDPAAFHVIFSRVPELFAEFSIKYLQTDASLEHVINHYDAHEVWLVYLEGRQDNFELKIRYITHGVLLCEDIDEFHFSCDVLTQDERLAQANMILDTYFAQGCDRPVMLSLNLLQDIHAAIDAASVDETLFAHARREVIDQMDVAIFVEFKKSTKYANILAKLVCLTELPSQLSPAMKAHLNFQVFKHRHTHAIINNYTWASASPR
ncbi:Aste57867_21447 [Aphanomyces stellatus]|uniref:Aste57867_21447 protein n=1 Tax=Aphanomyces stellatus TaxID=120398 RepID=A0A485LHH5_9STRA|nr:hypothetical protein As57867_021378 [Aphanomyces stellatus]VFT98118.1 Aste57867_21447 [Aphanomyces stellatus]